MGGGRGMMPAPSRLFKDFTATMIYDTDGPAMPPANAATLDDTTATLNKSTINPAITAAAARPTPTISPREWIKLGFYAAFGATLLAVLGYTALKISLIALTIATPFIVGFVLSMLLDPLVGRLERRGVRRILGVAFVFGLFFLILVGIAVYGVPALIAEARDLSDKSPQYIETVRHSVNVFLKSHRKIGSFKMPKNFDVINAAVTARFSAGLQKSAGDVTSLLVGSVSTLVEIVVTLIVTFYLLIDIDRLRARVFYLMPERGRKRLAQIGGDVGQVFSDYLRGLLIVCALYGLFTIILLYGLSFFKHGLAQYALLVGVAAGVLYSIPYIGALTTALVTFLVASAAGGLSFGVWAILATLLLNQIFDYYVTPRIVGGGVGLHPVIALFSLTLGGALFGFWGLLFSVPIAASIQVILFRYFPILKTPTPDAFLRAQGIRPSEGASTKILADAPEETKAEKAREKEQEEEEKRVYAKTEEKR